MSMQQRKGTDYPDRDLSPEHTKRQTSGPHSNPEVSASYDYVDSVLDTSDFEGAFAWHGWALREAFLAGATHAQEQAKKKNHKAASNCKGCNGTGYASIPGCAGGRCVCMTNGKPVRA